MLFALTPGLAAQSGSAAYFLVVAQSIFANRILQTIKVTAPQLNPDLVLGTGASDLHNVFNDSNLTAVLGAYMTGIKDVFACGLACSALAVFLVLAIPSKKLSNHDSKKTEEKVSAV